MEAPSSQQLDAMRYWELQKLAKAAGLKANLKAHTLLRMLKLHFHPQNKSENIKSHHKMGIKNTQGSKCKNKLKKLLWVDQTNKQINLETVEKTEIRLTQTPTRGPDVPADKKTPKCSGHLIKSSSKPSTPNFKKLHEAHFKKMESIDKYMERKRKRLEAVGTSIHNVKETKDSLSLLNTAKWTTDPSSHSPLGCSAELNMSSKSIVANKSDSPDFSSSKINNRFSEATNRNEKLPAGKMSSTTENVSRSLRSIENAIPLSAAVVKSEPAVTPLKFSAQSTETPKNNQKSRFDLKASLARPLAYCPHKGKLKPWGDSKEKQSTIKTNVSLLKNTFKQPHLRTREERRIQHEKDRKNKRDQTFGTRRGVAPPPKGKS